MRAVLVAALLACACRIDLDHKPVDANTSGRRCKVSTATACKDAEAHSDFAWIEQRIFGANCFGSSCHTGATASGKLDLSMGNAFRTLMGPDGTGVVSNLDDTRKLVVPGDPAASYLFFMIRGIEPEDGNPPYEPPPDTVGYMPMSNALLCCQKVDAIERWITAGAKND